MNYADAPGGLALKDQFYIYDLVFTSAGLTAGQVAASATATATITIQADSNFMWEATTFFASEHGLTQPLLDNIQRPFTIQITDSGVGRNFFSGSTPVDQFAGVGKFPFVLPQPYLWRAVSNIQATLTSLDGSNQWDNCTLSFVGKKTYGTYPVNQNHQFFS